VGSTYTTVFSLPGKKIQQRRQWLSYQTETDPEDAVADDFAMSF